MTTRLQEIMTKDLSRFSQAFPSGNSQVFSIHDIDEPITLAINKNGIHFIRQSPKEYMFSVELSEIKGYGKSKEAVFFEFTVFDIFHKYEFQTNQGEAICFALRKNLNEFDYVNKENENLFNIPFVNNKRRKMESEMESETRAKRLVTYGTSFKQYNTQTQLENDLEAQNDPLALSRILQDDDIKDSDTLQSLLTNLKTNVQRFINYR